MDTDACNTDKLNGCERSQVVAGNVSASLNGEVEAFQQGNSAVQSSFSSNQSAEQKELNNEKSSESVEVLEEEEQEVQQERELSLTDHLNKRLLNAFLNRINQSSPIDLHPLSLNNSDIQEHDSFDDESKDNAKS